MPTLLNELKLPPDTSGYTTSDGPEVVAAKLDGGASRRRRDIIGATSIVNVTWRCNDAKFKYLRAFYRSVAEGGATPFNIGLLLDDPTITMHKAYFVPGSMQLNEQSGQLFVVAAQLEVFPLPVDNVANLAYIASYETFGEDQETTALLFDKLINEELPSDI
jgi:hypothetical protein